MQDSLTSSFRWGETFDTAPRLLTFTTVSSRASTTFCLVNGVSAYISVRIV